ncbi:MAG TPA: hypothetical protein VFE62_16920 [Gemmataceae bacterium]|nr:hypothetical protein [Gemmataceae bacterium]
MYRQICLALVVAVSAPMCVGAQGLEGNWKFNYNPNGNAEQSLAIVSLKDKSGDVVASRLAGAKFKSVTQEGSLLHVAIEGSGIEFVFEGMVPKGAVKEIPGSITFNGNAFLGSLVATEDTKLTPANSMRVLPCPPLAEARKLAAKVTALRQNVLKTQDNDKKSELLKQLEEADQLAKKETPRLYREVLEKHAESPVIFDVGLSLLRTAKTDGSKLDDVKSWSATLTKAAKAYGPSWESNIVGQVASTLVKQDAFAPLGLDYARQAERGLTDKTPASDQVRVLSIVRDALKKTGKTDEATKLDLRVNKLEDILDREYSAKMPGFKGDAFPGRKSKSDRVVFMELFTGASCPPCVAADLAFDVLQKSYKPTDLVMVQYHMHIPAPDPLTNSDTEARWAYYKGKVRGVPASLFNGSPKASGGGGAANAKSKYEAYRDVIDSLIDEDGKVKLTAKAQRDGDKIDIHVKVTGLADPGKDKKLRILLTEETVRFVGGNRIRLHHNVVRAAPGGVAGSSLKDEASKHNVSIDIGELRGRLTKYLDNYETNFRPFANPSRPLAMQHLRVIAFVQDDATQEILQAIQVDVQGK